jgi:hypothetical protein
MADCLPKVHETLAEMNTEERRAYSKGLSQTYAAVFDAFGIAFEEDADIHAVYKQITMQWKRVCDTQVREGVL